MFHGLAKLHRRTSASKTGHRKGKPVPRSRRLAIESLETRELLSATPLSFRVVDDASLNKTFAYSASGTSQGATSLATANSAPRGVATMIGVDKTWVIDANRTVYVYNAAGGLLGSWAAGSMAASATPEGIATDGKDVWIIESRNHMAYRYANAASRLSGSQTAASSFFLGSGATQTDVVTDGHFLWVLDNGKKADWVHKWSTTGSDWGYWQIDAANKTPTGIALDPANIGDIWISDSGTDRVYRYAGATGFFGNSLSATSSFALASGNGNSQGIAVAGRPWAETPYQVEWVRQFGTAGNDEVRGLTVDTSDVVYLSGGTSGALAAANPNGLPTPYLARYDAAGNPTWIQQDAPIAGAAEYGGIRVVTDSQGNIFQIINLVSESYGSALRSYDPTGTLRWEAVAPVGERLFDVTVDAQGFAYTASHESNDEKVHIRKLNGGTGGVAWEVVVQALGTTGISADEMGNVYVSAHTSGALLGSTAGAVDALVIKVSESGNVQWTRQYGSAGSDLAFYGEADAFGNVYSAGRTNGSLGGPNSGWLDVFLAKHDSAGNLLWKQQWGTSGDDTRADVWIDTLGNVYRAIETTAALGGVPIGGKDIVIAKTDPNGNLLWTTQVGTAGDDDAAGGIWGDVDGNIYVTGGTTGSWGAANAGVRDAYVIKLSPPPAQPLALSALTATSPNTATTSNSTLTATKKHSHRLVREHVFATPAMMLPRTPSAALNSIATSFASDTPKCNDATTASAFDLALETTFAAI